MSMNVQISHEILVDCKLKALAARPPANHNAGRAIHMFCKGRFSNPLAAAATKSAVGHRPRGRPRGSTAVKRGAPEGVRPPQPGRRVHRATGRALLGRRPAAAGPPAPTVRAEARRENDWLTGNRGGAFMQAISNCEEEEEEDEDEEEEGDRWPHQGSTRVLFTNLIPAPAPDPTVRAAPSAARTLAQVVGWGEQPRPRLHRELVFDADTDTGFFSLPVRITNPFFPYATFSEQALAHFDLVQQEREEE